MTVVLRRQSQPIIISQSRYAPAGKSLWYSLKRRSRGSSVSIVSGYGLDNRAIGVRSPAGAKVFSSNLYVQTGSEAHPASCRVDTGGPFPGAKRGRGVTLTTHPHLMPRSRMSRSYTSSPASATMVCSGTAYFFYSLKRMLGYFVYRYNVVKQPCRRVRRWTTR
jgi:hypothetical protein